MKIMLIRHGEAESSAPSDAERRLTARGETEVLACINRACTIQGVAPVAAEQILASPFVRAQQTAALVQGVLTPPIPIETWAEITPSGSSEIVLDKIINSNVSELVIVTHQPFVSRFIFYLTGAETRMGTASITSIRMDAMVVGCGEVEWILHSEC